MGILYDLVIERQSKEREIEKAKGNKEIAKATGKHQDITKYGCMENKLKDDLDSINNQISKIRGNYYGLRNWD